MKASAEVVAVPPALFTIRSAALYLACSPAYLDKLRAQDVRRRDRGQPIEGPRWECLPYGIRYEKPALDEYNARARKPFGVMESRRRPKLVAGAAT